MKLIAKKAAGILAVASVVALTGCNTAKPIAPQHVGGETVNFSYMAADEDGKAVTHADILAAALAKAKSTSKYIDYGKKWNPDGKYYWLYGKTMELAGTSLMVDYANGRYHPDTGSRFVTHSKASFEFDFKPTAGMLKGTMTPPAELASVQGGPVFHIKPLDTTAKLADDLLKIGKAFPPSIERKKAIAGEFTVEYDDKSVYGSFERILGKYSPTEGEHNAYDISKDSVYTLAHRELRVPVKVSVFPYRGKSKVQYEFLLPYELTPDGKSTYDQGVADDLIALVSKVAND